MPTVDHFPCEHQKQHLRCPNPEEPLKVQQPEQNLGKQQLERELKLELDRELELKGQQLQVHLKHQVQSLFVQETMLLTN